MGKGVKGSGNEGSSCGRRVLSKGMRKLLRPKRGTLWRSIARFRGKSRSRSLGLGIRFQRDIKKPLKRWFVQMLYGVQASKDVRLSNIARSLNDEIPLIKTETRLSRKLGRKDLTGSVDEKLVAAGSRRIQHETVIALAVYKWSMPYKSRYHSSNC